MSENHSQALRGMQDFLGESSLLYRNLEQLAFETAQRYGYQEIRTPLLESSAVFYRTLGETSDAVTKETYTFLDRGGDSVTLRPEGTAPVVRALISNGLTHELPLKFFYSGAMFRYERPQKGRYRQFHQIGVEAMGFDHPQTDIETIALGYQILTRLGLGNRVTLEINTLGDQESRAQHRQAFLDYLTPYKNQLSTDSQLRLEKNPLRILDSKSPEDQKIISQAPKLKDYLNPHSQSFFQEIIQGLEALKIPFMINDRLVRGFDYYNHTVFEFTTNELGAQSAVLSGGRYNGLVELMGGPATACVGWGAGIERLLLMLQGNPHGLTPLTKKIIVLPMEFAQMAMALELAQTLRQSTVPLLQIELLSHGKLGKRLQKANKKQFHLAMILGETEVAARSVMIKNLISGEQDLCPLDHLPDHHWIVNSALTAKKEAAKTKEP